jgi:hypothetical protein
MKLLVSAFIVGVFLSASICRAENLCPWINKATAFGVLGGSEEAATASVSEISNTACSFVYRDEDITRELRVTVEQAKDPEQTFTTYKARCGADASPLRAIGNEAVMCAADQKGRGEMVISRVRDNVFTIKVSTSSPSDPSMPHDALVQKAGLVAEQVSGNLF